MNENPFGSDTEKKESESSEYSYSRESIPHPSYVDANYRVEVSAAAKQNQTQPEAETGTEKKKKAKKGGAGKLVAACLVCALLGGVAGGGIVAAISDNDSDGGAGDSSLILSNSAYTGEPVSVPEVDGSVLTGAQIYALGCQQAVGISTEITYTNFMGMQSSAAVSGSGFIVTENGYIVTNYHVISEAYEGGYDVEVMLYNGESYDAEIIGGDEDSDLAVLKINASGLAAATLGSSSALQVGDAVYAIGNPLGELSFSMTGGMVSALDRDITTGSNYSNTTNTMFQFDAAINEGNSGGPVYNNKGEVVGIATAKYEDTGVEGLGFAIPTDEVAEMIDDIINKGYVSGKAYFGISVDKNYDTAAQYYKMVQGAYVSAVTEGSCAEKAGLKVDDVITAINDTEISSSTELISAKRDYKAGETVTLKVYRGGSYIDIKVTLDEEQHDASSGQQSGDQSGNQQQYGIGGSLSPLPKS